MKNKNKEKTEWDRHVELINNTIEALLLGFQEPIKYDYEIPRSYEIKKLAGHALGEICGTTDDARYQSLINSDVICWSLLDNTRIIQPRVREGLEVSLSSSKDENSHLDIYMAMRESTLRSEWFYLIGEMYTFRPGKREELEIKVKKYWRKKELANFEKINEIVRRECKILYDKKKER